MTGYLSIQEAHEAAQQGVYVYPHQFAALCEASRNKQVLDFWHKFFGDTEYVAVGQDALPLLRYSNETYESDPA